MEDDDFDDSQEESTEETEEPARTVFMSNKGYVPAEEADRISQQGFYGTRMGDGRLELDPIEMLHLIERKRIMVTDSSGHNISAKEVVNELIDDEPKLWTDYLVFRDLRSRGYAVRQGIGSGIGFRVYSRGDKPGSDAAQYLVYVLKEGEPISLTDLDRVTEFSAKARKKLVFALVDQNGEVNYYRVAQAVLERKIGDDE